MSKSSPLTLTAVELSTLARPTTQAEQYASWLSSIDSSSAELVASIPSWPKGKTYHSIVESRNQAAPPGAGETQGYKWHARSSRHANQDLMKWFEGLGRDHSIHEAEYIPAATKPKRIDVFEKGKAEVWEMTYNLPFPTTNRCFLFLIIVFPPDPQATLKSFRVVSLPVERKDNPPPKGTVRGKYVSVEHVAEDGQGGVVWTMATASTPGGKIPSFVSELAMPSQIAEDVPAFLHWLDRRS